MRGCADFIRQDKADAGKDYGAFGVQRLCIRSTEDISGDSGIISSFSHEAMLKDRNSTKMIGFIR